jgi:hypothetical protein
MQAHIDRCIVFYEECVSANGEESVGGFWLLVQCSVGRAVNC